MDVSDIELIETVARLGSLSEASKRLNQSQPTLSRKLFRLEDSLRAQLFHRSPKGLQPTEIAKYIIAEAAPLNAHLRAISRYVELATQLEAGSVNVGVGPIIEQILLPEVLAHFLDTTGDVKVSVVTEDEQTLLQLFEASELDVVIGPIDPQHRKDKGVIVKPMISDKIVAMARACHPIFKEKKVTEENLGQFPLVIPRTQGSIRQSERGPTVREPKVVFDNYSLLKELTAKQNVICAGPKAVFGKEIESGELNVIDIDLKIYWESALLVRPETYSTPVVKHFVDLCESVAHKVHDNSR